MLLSCCTDHRVEVHCAFFRAGENISPREVEEFIHGHPAVAEVQVRCCGVAGLRRHLALCCVCNRAVT